MPEDAFDASWQPTPDPREIIIPGVDPELPITVQTEQIDQLITLKLQNIDKNFAKCHQIITTKILPALKKYSAGSQPTRDAAKFWRGFFEAAAQIRVSVDEDGVSTLGERTPNDGSYEANRTPQPGPMYHEDTSDGSDLTFRRGAVSSTPQVQKFSQVVDSVDHSVDTNDSWVARSVESPIMRIDRQLKDLAFDDEQDTQSSVQQPVPSAAPRTGKPLPLPHFESDSGLSIHNISAHQPSSSSSGILFAVPEPSPQMAGVSSSPNRGKGRRKSAARDLRQGVLKSNLMNTAKPSGRWDGITDLRNATSTTDSTVSTLPEMSFGENTRKAPVPLQPYSPSRTRETLQRTPSKQAAALLVRNVLSKMPPGSDRSITPADTSVVSSVAPSTSYNTRNYGSVPSSTSSGSVLERRPNPIHGLFGLSPDDLLGSGLASKTSKPPQTDTRNTRLAGPSRQAYVEESPVKWQDDSGLVSPAPYGGAEGDDSYDRSRSTDSSFDNDETRYGGAEDRSQWAGEDRGDGYSSGNQGPEDDETVFGARQAAPVQPGPASRHRFSNMFALPEVSATYYGGRLEDAAVGEESPTPAWMGAAARRGR
ncbi:DASH complex subunit ask1 [Ceratobasidium sp. 414]|nr:DASH complex subunit ask1 [Ceratobasidium sp. 414]